MNPRLERRRSIVWALLAALMVSGLLSALAWGRPIAIHGTGTSRPNGVYQTTPADRAVTDGLGTWAPGVGDRGRIVSDTFRAPPLISLALAGGPGRPGESVVIQRVDSGETLSLVPAVEPGEQWEHIVKALPINWWGHPVVVVADDEAAGFRGWIGIGALAVAGPAGLLADFGALALPVVLVLLAALLVVPAIAVACVVVADRDRQGVMVYAVSLAVLGACAECAFFLFRANAVVAPFIVGAVVIGGWAYVGFAFSTPRLWRQIVRRDVWMPWALSLTVALAYAIVLVQTTAVGATVLNTATNAWWHFPIDNMLPDILARQVQAGAPPKPFVAEWLASDRPPLQAGFDLFTIWMFPSPLLDASRYEALGMWLQCWSFGGLFVLARACGFGIRRSVFAVGCGAATGFFFINAVFTWPKLITIAFASAAIAIAVADRVEWRRVWRFAMAGGLFAFAMLGHEGVVFTAPALVVAALVRDRIVAVKPLIAGAIVAAAILAPWTMYQKFIDPPGDRLVKWHLGGQIPVDTSRSATEVIEQAYASKTFPQIVAMKMDNLRQLAPIYGWSRPSEFYSPVAAVGVLWIPFIWLVFARTLSPPERLARGLALTAVGSVLLWCMMMWTGTAIITGSYQTMALLVFPAALFAARSRGLAIVVVVALTVDIVWIWMVGVVPATSLALDLVAMLVCVGLVIAPGSPLRRLVSRTGPSAIAAESSRIRSY